MNLCDYSEISALLERHGFRFSRSMGQNFLIDPAVPAAIAQAAGIGPDSGVLEIGPGIGCLTAQLARRAGKVVAVEVDRSLLPVLRETLAEFSNVEIVCADATKLDLTALAAQKLPGLQPAVCANLPYNITTPVLTALAEAPCFTALTLMLQREAAARVCAGPGEAGYGPLSILMRLRMETSVLFDVPPRCFHPAPKVTSSVLRCVRRSSPAVEATDEEFLLRVIRGAFLLRRKTLANSLAAALPEFPKYALTDAIRSCGLPDGVRGEQLALRSFADLAQLLLTWRK